MCFGFNSDNVKNNEAQGYLSFTPISYSRAIFLHLPTYLCVFIVNCKESGQVGLYELPTIVLLV